MTAWHETGVFGPEQVRELVEFYRANGFAVLRNPYSAALMGRMTRECVAAQDRVISGELPARYGSTVFLDEAAKADRFANYVEHVEELSPAVREAIAHPVLQGVMHLLLSPEAWTRDGDEFGIVYQDARPGRESGYSRIGWHSDWQASPSLEIWPSTAFTFHIDATSPANGFLRVVPGSHLWATPAPWRNVNNVPVPDSALPYGGYTTDPPPFPMPLGFEKVRGEIGVYTEVGDVILHDAYLWHSAARATDDATTRRHVRGSYFAGDRSQSAAHEFVKNAAR